MFTQIEIDNMKYKTFVILQMFNINNESLTTSLRVKILPPLILLSKTQYHVNPPRAFIKDTQR